MSTCRVPDSLSRLGGWEQGRASQSNTARQVATTASPVNTAAARNAGDREEARLASALQLSQYLLHLHLKRENLGSQFSCSHNIRKSGTLSWAARPRSGADS